MFPWMALNNSTGFGSTPAASKWIEVGLALLLSLSLVVPSLAADFELTRLLVFQVLALVLVALFCFWRSKVPPILLSLPVLLLLLWLISRFGSAFFASGAYRPWHLVGRDCVLVVWMLLVAASGNGSLFRLLLPRMVSLWLLGSCLVGFFCMASGSGYWKTGPGGAAILGYAHPNSLACAATLGGLLAMAGVFQPHARRCWQMTCLLGAGASLGIQVLTDSRSGLLLLLVLMPLESWWLWRLYPKRPAVRVRLMVFAGLGLLLTLMALGLPVFQARIESVVSGRGTMARVGLWHATGNLIAEDRTWTGRGPGALAYEVPRVPPYEKPDGEHFKLLDRHTHNGYLELWLESGMFSLLFWAGILWILIAGTREALRSGRQELIASLFAGIAFLLFGVHSIATMLIGSQILFYAVLGVILANSISLRSLSLKAPLWLPVVMLPMVLSLPSLARSHEASRLLKSLILNSGPSIQGIPREEMIERALALDERNVDLRMEQLYHAAIQGHGVTAKRAFEAIQNLIPGYSNAEVLYSHWLASQGRHEQAAALMEDFASVNPHLLGVWIHLAIHQKDAGDEMGRAATLRHILSHSVERLNRRHRIEIRMRMLDGMGLSQRAEVTTADVELPPFPLRLLDQTLFPSVTQSLESRGRLAMSRLIRFFQQLGVGSPDLLRD